jgi:hypothetical protein
MVALDRLVFLVSWNFKSSDWLNQKLRDHGLTVERVTNLRLGSYGSSISGIIHFDKGRAEFSALKKPPFFKRPFFSPLVPVYRSALRPVTTRITGSWRPLPRAFGGALIAAIWITFCVVIIAVGLVGRRDVVQREQMSADQRIWSAIEAAEEQLPDEVRQFVKNRDHAAVGAWMQAHRQNPRQYVPDDVVLAQANVMRQILAIAPPASCAAIADGTMTQPAMNELLRELSKQDSAALTTWFECQDRVLLESLKSQHTFPVSKADKRVANVALYNGLSEQDKARYRRVTDNPEQSSAEDKCWLEQTIFQGIEKLQEPSRSKLARVGLGQDVEN